MYIIGHTAIAYLFLKTLFVGTKKRLEPKIIIFIFVFANIIDVLHIGYVRIMIHNLFGTFLFAGVCALFFFKLKIIEKKQIIILMIATTAHIIGDYLFGEFYFLYPFAQTRFSTFGFHSLEHFMTESILVIIFLMVFLFSKDFNKLLKFINTKKKEFRKDFNLKKLFNPNLFTFYLFIAFYCFVIAQFIIFVRLNYFYLHNHFYYSQEFISFILLDLFVFAIFIIILSIIIIVKYNRYNRSSKFPKTN
jgi:hypothetical protein